MGAPRLHRTLVQYGGLMLFSTTQVQVLAVDASDGKVPAPSQCALDTKTLNSERSRTASSRRTP